MVEVQRSLIWKWPTVLAKAEGQGLLVRVEMSPPEACRPGEMLGGVLAAGTANIQVRLSKHPDPPSLTGSVPEPDSGSLEPLATTKERSPLPPNGGRLSAPGESREVSEYPSVAEVPRSRSAEEDLLLWRRGLTLEISMYALLGVFCVAILVFLVNCGSYTYRYRSKPPSSDHPGMMTHAHEWVWLGQEEGLCLQQQQDEPSGPLEAGSQLLEGAGTRGRDESLTSPTTQRKRVNFTTFSSRPMALVQTRAVKWACPFDVELSDSQEPSRTAPPMEQVARATGPQNPLGPC